MIVHKCTNVAISYKSEIFTLGIELKLDNIVKSDVRVMPKLNIGFQTLRNCPTVARKSSMSSGKKF